MKISLQVVHWWRWIGNEECCSEDDDEQNDNHSQYALFVYEKHHCVQFE